MAEKMLALIRYLNIALSRFKDEQQHTDSFPLCDVISTAVAAAAAAAAAAPRHTSVIARLLQPTDEAAS